MPGRTATWPSSSPSTTWPRSWGIEPGELERIVAYLEDRQWIAVDDYRAGIVRLTADGVDRVELGADA